MSKPKAVLIGPVISEMGWEIQRFSSMIPFIRKKFKGKDIKFIVLTRKDRFDLYGVYADVLIPLNIEGDYTKYLPNCFRLNGFSVKEYENIAKHFYKKYSKKYEIIRHIYPKINGKEFLKKNQFQQKEMSFKYSPRKRNFQLIDEYIENKEKPIIILAPRFRKGFKRNWPYWNELYEMIYKNKLQDDFNFVICGKPGEYVPDEKNRFYDINKITMDDNSSLIGLVIVLLKMAHLTIGSQSAIPNLSLLLKVKALEWGHQKSLHTKTYNVKKTPVVFLDDPKYRLPCKTIYENIFKQLEKIKRGKKK